MHSTVTLYAAPYLAPEKNFVVEYIEDYLNTYNEGLLSIANFQYQRLEREKVIKIAASQTLDSSDVFPYNYVKIENESNAGDPFENAAYYFVVGYEQRAENTIALSLQLDVLNTFYDFYKTRFDESTYIRRAHKNRFRVMTKATNYIKLGPIFDHVPEGDSPQLFEKTNRRVIADERWNDAADYFYLIYRTSAASGAPCIDFCADQPVKIGEAATGNPYTLLCSDMAQGRYYYLLGPATFTLSNNSGAAPIAETFTINNGFAIFWKDGDDIKARVVDENNFVEYIAGAYQQSNPYLRVTAGDKLYFSSSMTADAEEIRAFSSIAVNAGTGGDIMLSSIAALDRTDSRIVKVIECPYCPVNFTYDEDTGAYTFDHFTQKSPEGFLRTYDLQARLPSVTLGNLNLQGVVTEEVEPAQITQPSIPVLEDPKLKTSPYFMPILFYDNFQLPIRLEDFIVTPRQTGQISLAVRYKQSSDISSALCFYAEPSGGRMFRRQRQAERYEPYMPVTRNNEIPLYSSDYLNYLRNGFNYDKKKQEQALGQQATMAGIQAIASLLSFALAAPTGGISAAAGIGLAAGALGSAASLAFNKKEGEDALAQKINQLKAQSFRVSSVDDLDLLKTYSDNKLFYTEVSLTNEEHDAKNNAFREFGYAVGRNGKPNDFDGQDLLNSRRYYNFLQCDPVFVLPVEQRGLTGVVEYAPDIAERFSAGVTIWHRDGYTARDGVLDTYVENIENSVYNEVI